MFREDRRITVHYDNKYRDNNKISDDAVTIRSKHLSLTDLHRRSTRHRNKIRNSSPNTSSKNEMSSGDKPEKPPKEKKKKDVSVGRQKKFYRHFQQVSSDEKIINYFSCALVGDILLQGHLYVTQTYFAFYSNVFGYVTKLLIPISSVVNISKEKTAKMFPNAIGVETDDDGKGKHVFGSFIKREQAFQLMLTMWNQQKTMQAAETVKVASISKDPEIEISEISVEDDSSCSVSDNDQSPSPQDTVDHPTIEVSSPNHQMASNSPKHNNNNSNSTSLNANPDIAKTKISSASTLPIIINSNNSNNNAANRDRSATRNTNNTENSSLDTQQHSTEFNLLYIGVALAILLAVISVLLLLKINNIQNNSKFYNYPDLRSSGENAEMETDIYSQWLKWQTELQSKSVEEAELILNSNLKEVIKVRKSLEALQNILEDSFMKYPPTINSNGHSNEEHQEF